MDLQLFITPGISALAAWVATIAVIKTDIAWIKKRLSANEKAGNHTASRLDRHIENSR